jgi:hypothetical protein
MNTLAITDLVNIVSGSNLFELGIIALPASIIVIAAILAIIKVAMKPMALLALAGLLGWGLLTTGWFSF